MKLNISLIHYYISTKLNISLFNRYEAQAAHNSSHAALNGKLVAAADMYKTQQNKFRAILEFIEGQYLVFTLT